MSASMSVDPVAANRKTIIYVGGLDEAVDEAILTAAFLPFGEIKQVHMPKEGVLQKHRGFGLVEFQDGEDAAAALENMHESELFGRVLKCNLSKPNVKGVSGAIWAGEAADQWYGNLESASSVDAQIAHQQIQDAAKARGPTTK